MKKMIFLTLYFALFAGVPVLLALGQDVPVGHTYQQWVLFLSLAGFGLLLGLFWLSRLYAREAAPMKFSSTMRWHKYIGYVGGLFMLVHPVLMIGRRFLVEESNPLENLILMVKSPLMLTGIIAWFLLLLIVALAFVRKYLNYQTFRIIHGILSLVFAVFSTWHVIRIGRHSNLVMSVFWILAAGTACISLLLAYLPVHKAAPVKIYEGETHEPA
ncbi:ferric reductase-like transmembrane domain-containing protein [Pontiella agarivorans]|uniref:Ferric reductase-like transmembrane domain-containing protein n=1 Tax=Pontiella agarivorans TaxID=3038953 RepID=A0ABU5MVW0_9BACT|nr:ferric reductase-like transmembrane domain-containing protein [Pontiella agarivorans]MDZ8118323.1 ferric reductase-like transmembrane domain-containing protein [Pontiella agarivorans]